MTAGQERQFLLPALGLATINLRTSLLATSPLLPLIQSDLNLSYLEAGIILSLPVVMLGLGALPGAAVVGRWSTHKTISYGLLATTLAALVRVVANDFWFLFLTTAILAAGVGLVQPSLPVLVRERFPDAVGTATSIYSSGLTAGATAAAVVTPTLLLPLAGATTWRGALFIWGAVSCLAWFFWWTQTRQFPADGRAADIKAAGGAGGTGVGGAGAGGTEDEIATTTETVRTSVWREPFLWKIAFLFAGQSILFHIFTSWLPTFYESLGWTLAKAAVPIGLLTALQVPTTLFMPALADRYGIHRPLLLAAVALTGIGELGVIFAPAALGGVIWGLSLGIGIGAIFSLTLTLQANHDSFGSSAKASGMMFGVGYAGAAVGPVLLGLIRDVSGSFTGGFAATLGVSGALAILALSMPGSKRAGPSVGRGMAS